MAKYVSGKIEGATSPQSPIVRHLSFIKALSVVMAFLIVAAVAVIIVTIYGRMTAVETDAGSPQSSIILPAGARVISASFGKNGQMLLLVNYQNSQHLWQFDRAGQPQKKIELRTLQP